MCLATPARIIAILDPDIPTAQADLNGLRREINLAALESPETAQRSVGRWVLVHVGFALTYLDEQDAQRTLHLLRQRRTP